MPREGGRPVQGGISIRLEHLGLLYVESSVWLEFLFRLWFLFFLKKKKLELYLFPVGGADRRRVCAGGGVGGEG